MAGIAALTAAVLSPLSVVLAAIVGSRKLSRVETAVNGHLRELVDRVELLEEVLSFVRSPAPGPGGRELAG